MLSLILKSRKVENDKKVANQSKKNQRKYHKLVTIPSFPFQS